MNCELTDRCTITDPRPLPLEGQDADCYLRKIELTVLDPFHRRFTFFQLPPNVAFASMLRAVDSTLYTLQMIRDTSKRPGQFVLGQRLKHINESLPIALRWAHPGPGVPLYSGAIDAPLIDKAGEVLVHAQTYAMLETFHVGYSRGVYRISACPKERVIRFTPVIGDTIRSVLFYSDLLQSQSSHLKTHARPGHRHVNPMHDVMPVFVDGCVSPQFAVSAVFPELISMLGPKAIMEILPLDQSWSMGAFTVGQFYAYWKVLHAWSYVASNIYLSSCEQGLPQEQCMPTQYIDRAAFIDKIAALTSLDRTVVDSITEFLTYGQGARKPDAFLHPLFTDGRGITWSSLIVGLSCQPRNALKLLCQRPHTRDAGASLNGRRELVLLRRFGNLLQTRAGYSFKLTTRLKSGGKEAEVDLLAYTRNAPNEVLLVQAKTPIAADDIAEIQEVSRDIEHAVAQSHRCEYILRGMSNQDKSAVFRFVDWARANHYFHLVITPDSEPGGRTNAQGVPAISLAAMLVRLRRRDFKRPSELCRVCGNRPWLRDLEPRVTGYERVVVGDAFYELPTFDLDELIDDTP